MGRGAWQTIVHGVPKSGTQLNTYTKAQWGVNGVQGFNNSGDSFCLVWEERNVQVLNEDRSGLQLFPKEIYNAGEFLHASTHCTKSYRDS